MLAFQTHYDSCFLGKARGSTSFFFLSRPSFPQIGASQYLHIRFVELSNDLCHQEDGYGSKPGHSLEHQNSCQIGVHPKQHIIGFDTPPYFEGKNTVASIMLKKTCWYADICVYIICCSLYLLFQMACFLGSPSITSSSKF